jgi:hypothetical protein
MKIADLKRDMDGQFATVAEQFRNVDEQFRRVDERFRKVDAEFKAVRAEIRSEGEITRRHFDVVSEHLVAEMRLSFDKIFGVAQHVTRVESANAQEHAGFTRSADDHEVRIKTLERKPPVPR